MLGRWERGQKIWEFRLKPLCLRLKLMSQSLNLYPLFLQLLVIDRVRGGTNARSRTDLIDWISSKTESTILAKRKFLQKLKKLNIRKNVNIKSTYLNDEVIQILCWQLIWGWHITVCLHLGLMGQEFCSSSSWPTHRRPKLPDLESAMFACWCA